MFRLRNRIFLVILIGLVPIVLAAALGVSAVNRSHANDVAALEAAVLGQKAHEIENFVGGEVLSHPSVVVPYGSGMTISTSAQQFALKNILDTLPFVESESFVDVAGKETARIDRATYPSGYTPSSLRDLSGFHGFVVARGGQYYLGTVSHASGTPVVDFAAPVKSDAGDIIAVTVGVANLRSLEDMVGAASIGSTGYLYLVDQQGNLIAGGGPFAATKADAAAASAKIAALPIVQRVTGGTSLLTADAQMKYNNAAGVPVIAAAQYLPQYGWGLIAEWPEAEANALIADLLWRNALALAAVLLAAFAVSFLLAAYIVRPIKELQEGAARVAQGKFGQGVSIRTHDELEDLGNSFNDMVQGLAQLERLKDEFVFIAAHELRTPVAAMKGYLSLILDGNVGGGVAPEVKAYLEKAIASDDRLAQLVNDLLEVARSQAGRLTIKVAPVDIIPPTRGVLDELKTLSDERSVKLVYEPQSDLPKVMGDPDRIKEVLVNLVGNAIKYMGGAGTVTVAHELANGMLVTRVADTGLGIAREAQEKLFEKFYRVQTEKTRDIVGTGLGLFIVREIIEKMGGTIGVVSEEGKGSTFSFSLPVAGA